MLIKYVTKNTSISNNRRFAIGFINFRSNYIFSLVCFGFLVPLASFSLNGRRHYYRWRAANFDLYLALMAIEQREQRGFFSVSHLLWHGTSVHNGHTRGLVTLTPVAECLAEELPLHVSTLFRSGIEPWSPAREANALPTEPSPRFGKI